MTIQITPSQLDVYRATACKREAALKIQLEARRLHAWVIARQAAVILKEEFGSRRVVVFGSLLHPGRFHLSSDIDIAVWGIQDYFRAVSRLIDLDPEMDFDLVPIEDAYPGILAAITQEGMDL
jgi:predicted nucleotidyltransferase